VHTAYTYSHLTPVWSRPNDVGFLERNVAQRCIVALELVELQCAVIIGRTRYTDCTALHLHRQRRRYISTTTTTTPEEFIITSFRDLRASETDGRRVVIPASFFNIYLILYASTTTLKCPFDFLLRFYFHDGRKRAGAEHAACRTARSGKRPKTA